jgi:hypothetical protein
VDAFVRAELALHDLDVVRDVGQVRPLAGREVVEDAHAVAAPDERPDEVRADEPAAAGDEDAAGYDATSATTW